MNSLMVQLACMLDWVTHSRLDGLVTARTIPGPRPVQGGRGLCPMDFGDAVVVWRFIRFVNKSGSVGPGGQETGSRNQLSTNA